VQWQVLEKEAGIALPSFDRVGHSEGGVGAIGAEGACFALVLGRWSWWRRSWCGVSIVIAAAAVVVVVPSKEIRIIEATLIHNLTLSSHHDRRSTNVLLEPAVIEVHVILVILIRARFSHANQRTTRPLIPPVKVRFIPASSQSRRSFQALSSPIDVPWNSLAVPGPAILFTLQKLTSHSGRDIAASRSRRRRRVLELEVTEPTQSQPR